jgi:hypothetical protein
MLGWSIRRKWNSRLRCWGYREAKLVIIAVKYRPSPSLSLSLSILKHHIKMMENVCGEEGNQMLSKFTSLTFEAPSTTSNNEDSLEFLRRHICGVRCRSINLARCRGNYWARGRKNILIFLQSDGGKGRYIRARSGQGSYMHLKR